MDWESEISGVRRAPRPVLIVSDKSRVRHNLAGLLEHEGYPVLMATNGIDAIDLIEACCPAVVVVEGLETGVSAADLVGSLAACFGDETPPILVLMKEGERVPHPALGIPSDPIQTDRFVAICRQLMKESVRPQAAPGPR